MQNRINVTKSSLPSLTEYIEQIKPLWESGWLTNNGALHQEFTNNLCDYLESPYIELYTNGHMALDIAIKVLKLRGEVITTPFTFISTTHALTMNGITPVFCDVKEDDMTIDESKIESLITEKTSAILPVHVYGFPCNHRAIEAIALKYNLKLLYDGAHAFGVKTKDTPISKWGDATMFSFHATKVFHTIEGGALSFKDISLQKSFQLFKNFGIASEEEIDEVGLNAKMNEFCAAMGLCNLRRVQDDITSRKKAVQTYVEYLNDIPGIRLMPYDKLDKRGIESNYAYFPVVIDDSVANFSRDYLYEELKKYNIYTRKYFYPLTYEANCYKKGFYSFSCNTPNAKYISERVLALPLYANIELNVVEDISRRIIMIFKKG